METNVKNLHKQIANLLVAIDTLTNPWISVSKPPPLFALILVKDGGLAFVAHNVARGSGRYLALETRTELSDVTEWMHIPRTREEIEDDE